MPIQVDEPKLHAAVRRPAIGVLAVLVTLAVVVAVNWRLLFLVVIAMAAVGGYLLAK